MSTQSLPEHIRRRDVLHLAWPIMVSMLSYSAMTVIDTVYVAQLGTTPLAAVGIAGICAHLGFAFGIGLLRGSKVNVAQATGAGRHRRARRFAWQAIWLALGMGAVAALLAPAGPTLFALLGASPDVADSAAVYFGIRMLAAPLIFLIHAMGSYFEGTGDTRTPMVGTVLTNVINIVLDPVLIFGLGPFPALGLAGAAIATNVALLFGVAWLGWSIRHALRGVWRWPHRALLGRIWHIGSPVGTHYILDVIGFTVFVSLLARAGDAHLAAHVIGVRIIGISFLPGHALGEAVGVLVGQAIGANRPALAREAWWSGTQLSLMIMTSCGLLFLAAPELLISVFSPEDDVVIIARQLLFIAAGFQIVDAVATVGLGALAGAGDTRFALVIGVANAWLVNLPLSAFLVLALGMGAQGAWLGLFAEITALAVFVVFRIRGAAWLEQSNYDLAEAVPAK